MQHSEKCRAEWHNYGKTPLELEQVTRRFKAWMRTPEFKALMRDEIQKAMAPTHPMKTGVVESRAAGD